MAFVSKRVQPEELSEFMRLARERYDFALQLDMEDRKLAEEDALFAAALPVQGAGTTQWDKQAAQDRINAKRPCLTENRLQTFTAQVVNDGRQSKPAIDITAMDNGTKENAEYIQGRIRQIEYDCNADIAYDTAREQQVSCSRAFLRITWEYQPGTFKRRPALKPIANQFSVVFGPHREYDCSDADYCFVINLITREEHKRIHGADTTAARTEFASNTNPAIGWLGTGPNGEMIQEAEYWLKEYRLRTLCELSNGRTYWEDELPPDLDVIGITVAQTRQEQDCTVVQYMIDGADILGETEFVGPYIGIVPQWGREQFVDGKPRRTSLIRYAKDPQRLLNLYVSNIAEQIGQMPKTPWMVPVGGIPVGSEAQWQRINTDPLAWLYYNYLDPEGRGSLPAPHRVVNEPPIAALVAGYNQAVDAIKAAMGIYDASLGNRSNETSRVAIDARAEEADNANFHFHDNEKRTRRHIGRILLCMLRELDKGTGQRAVRSEDGKTRMVRIGEAYRDEELGKSVTYDLSSGDYGVAVDTGPSYNSRRKQAFDTYWQIAKADKNFMQVAGDKIFRYSDFPGSDEIADRYEKLLPPEMQPQKKDAPQLPPEVAQKFQQIQQMAGETIERLTERVRELESEQRAERIQMESRERIASLQEQTKRILKVAELSQVEGLTLLQAELAEIKDRIQMEQARADRQYEADEAERNRQREVAASQDAAPSAEAGEAQPVTTPE